jgi:t-SNARE complex subunit (syntaxin)
MTQFDPKNYTIKEMKYYTDADIKQENIDRTRRVEGKARDIHAVAGHVRDGILGSGQNVDGILKQISSTNVNVYDGNDQLRIRAGNSHTKRLKMVLCLIIFAAIIITIYL